MFDLLLTALIITLAVGAALAPLEALGWWAGWFGHDHSAAEPGAVRRTPRPTAASTAAEYVVFLSGVGSARTGELPAEERPYITYLREHLPHAAVIDEVQPYSVLGIGLDSRRRPLAGMWLWMLERGGIWQQVINGRNLLQVLVSADNRYGPVISYGIARQIVAALLRHGYAPNSGTPITLIGSSGGAQMGLGAGPFIIQALGAPLRMVSLGGVMSANPALLQFEAIEQLNGSADPVATLIPNVSFSGRWPISRRSPWWLAHERGIFTERIIGPMTHTGKRGYYDAGSAMPDGTAFPIHSARETVATITRWGH